MEAYKNDNENIKKLLIEDGSSIHKKINL